MAYRLITNVASVADLIGSIRTFAGENGWTVHRNSATLGATLSAAGTDYVHLYTATETRLGMRLSIGYDGALAHNLQPNVAVNESQTSLVFPLPNVYLFANGVNLHVVMQIANAVEFRHVCIGMLNKAGVFTGGTYADGSYRSGQYLGDVNNDHHTPFAGFGNSQPGNYQPFPGTMRVDSVADAYANNFAPFLGNNGEPNSLTTFVNSYVANDAQHGMGAIVEGADRNSFSGRSILHPIRVFFVRATNERKSYVGSVNGTYLINMLKFTAGQEMTVGSDTYKVFPFFKRSVAQSDNSNAPDYGSHVMGYAIRKTM